jgi:hypothetical protein
MLLPSSNNQNFSTTGKKKFAPRLSELPVKITQKLAESGNKEIILSQELQ